MGNTESDKPSPSTLTELLRYLDGKGIRGYDRHAQIHRFLDFKAREKAVPLTGSFELTPLCNLDCKMCYVHLDKNSFGDQKLLSVDEWKHIIGLAVRAGMLYAKLTGGECLTYPGFKEIYLYLRSLGIETEIYTNGVLLDGEMLELFRKNRPSAVQITVYGASEEAYERVTGHRCFNRVIENIRKLREAKIPLRIVTTPNVYMTDGEEIVRLLHNEGLNVTVNSGLMAPREETGRAFAAAPLDMYVRMLHLKRELDGKEFVSDTEPEDIPDTGGASEKPFGVPCGAGRSAFSVDWRGSMKPCNTFPVKGENVFSRGFNEAWRLTNLTSAHFPLPEECTHCRYKTVCGLCVSEHAAGAPPGHVNSDVCERMKRMVNEGLLGRPV